MRFEVDVVAHAVVGVHSPCCRHHRPAARVQHLRSDADHARAVSARSRADRRGGPRAHGRHAPRGGRLLAGLQEAGFEAVPVLSARATPGGTIAQSPRRAPGDDLDAWMRPGPRRFVAGPHGAGVMNGTPARTASGSSACASASGRRAVVTTVDIHASISPAMLDASQAIVAYRTNPHMDQFDRGREAAVCSRACSRPPAPARAMSRPPMVINIERRVRRVALRGFAAGADEMRQRPECWLSAWCWVFRMPTSGYGAQCGGEHRRHVRPPSACR